MICSLNSAVEKKNAVGKSIIVLLNLVTFHLQKRHRSDDEVNNRKAKVLRNNSEVTGQADK